MGMDERRSSLLGGDAAPFASRGKGQQLGRRRSRRRPRAVGDQLSDYGSMTGTSQRTSTD
jgi:hypothetical protein